ncbi:universal stress protein [Streptomyces sp. NPDC093085]|uniref:universal stress protein n=1 Tax=Streptomyces sp. NPDC093085 TaxID=3155068 RepID=UPI00344102F1
MTRTITVGLDGSPESRAAAEWAAREARLRGLPLRVLYVFESSALLLGQAPLLGAETVQKWAEWVPFETVEGLRLRHPGIEISTERGRGDPARVLAEAADDAELLVLGSRGFGGAHGFFTGSVSLSVVARTTRPVVLVRAGEEAVDEHRMDPVGIPSTAAPFRPVVVGLDTGGGADGGGGSGGGDAGEAVLEFAFDAAARRGAPLRVVHAWPAPPLAVRSFYGDAESSALARERAAALSETVRPWRQKFPQVEAVEASRCGSAARVLVTAARDASLVVVGRRIRTAPYGPHVGHVAHAALHHVAAPVAVLAHC